MEVATAIALALLAEAALDEARTPLVVPLAVWFATLAAAAASVEGVWEVTHLDLAEALLRRGWEVNPSRGWLRWARGASLLDGCRYQ